MTRTAVYPSAGPMNNGMAHQSRIPRPGMNHPPNESSANGYSAGNQQKRSRLEDMQLDFQRRMMKEKEDKLINMYEENQRRALDKVQKTGADKSNGIVREFFQERRIMEASHGHALPIQQHYKQHKNQYSIKSDGVTINSRGTEMNGKIANQASYGLRSNPQSASSNGAGMSPLAPRSRISNRTPNSNYSHNSNFSGFAPIPPIHPPSQPKTTYQRGPAGSRAAGARGGGDATTKENVVIHRGQIYNKGGSHSNTERIERVANGAPEFDEHSTEVIHATLKPARQQRPVKNDVGQQSGDHSQHSPNKSPLTESNASPAGKMTDFQRWQLQQEHGMSHKGDDVSDKEIQEKIRHKEQEIADKLGQHQRDLDRMRQQRMSDEHKQQKLDQQAARQKEAEQRQADADAKKQKADEKKRKAEEKRQEAEERKKEEMENRRRREAERHKVMEERKEQSRQKQMPQRQAIQQTYEQEEEEEYIPPSAQTDFYAAAANAEGAYENANISMAECNICGRKFARDRLAKHKQACSKISKKRKVFDPTKMRLEGTDHAQYAGKAGKTKNTEKPAKKGADWRKQHESFIAAIRYAKKVSQVEASGGNVKDLPPPPQADTSHYTECPHCGRRFSPNVAERHIPKCSNIKSRSVKRK